MLARVCRVMDVEQSDVSDQALSDWKQIMEKAGPFPPEAFQFVREGLAHTVRAIHGGAGLVGDVEDESRHVSGQQLCLGLRDFAIVQFGSLARTVLERWGIRSTDDFGRIVFAMIDAGFMRKTDEDSMEDFRAVYEFDEAFVGPEHVA